MGFLFSLLVPSSTVKVAAVLPARAARSGARAAKSAARVAGSGALAVGFGTLNQGLAPAVSAMVEVAASARVARTGALAAGSPPPPRTCGSSCGGGARDWRRLAAELSSDSSQQRLSACGVVTHAAESGLAPRVARSDGVAADAAVRQLRRTNL